MDNNNSNKEKFDFKNWFMCNIFRLLRIVLMIAGIVINIIVVNHLLYVYTPFIFVMVFELALLVFTIVRLYSKRDDVYIGYGGFEIFGKLVVSAILFVAFITPTLMLHMAVGNL